MIKTISPSYGEGIVYSKVTIDSHSNDFTIKANVISSGIISDTYDWLNSLTGIDDYTDSFFGQPTDPNCEGIVCRYQTFTHNINMFIGKTFLTLPGMFMDFVDFSNKLFNEKDRGEALTDGFKFVISIFTPLIYVFLPIILIFEIFVIHEAFKVEGMSALSKYVTLHFDYMQRGFIMFRMLFKFIFDIMKLLIESLLSALNVITPW
jgi:hypothetical protein